jgi:hypothetical protein
MHMWVGVWLPMVMGELEQVLESVRCPMCASDTTQHQLHNDPAAVNAAAAECIDPPVPVRLEVCTDSQMAYDLRLLIGKVQLGSPIIANEHSRAVRFISALPRQIETAASYVLAVAQQQKKEGA